MKTTDLNLRELLFGQTARVGDVVRFGNCRRIHQENVAEHTFFTAFYAMMLARALGWKDEEIGWLLQRALVHDVEESESGDFPHPFKYSSPKLRAALGKASAEAFRLLVEPLVKDKGERKVLLDMWKNGKEGKGLLLGFADFLSSVSYMIQEIQTGNKHMLKEIPNFRKAFKHFMESKFDFIRPWINETAMFLEEINHGKS